MLVSKLQKMPDLLQVYSLFRSRNSEDDDAEDVHYLPHHLMKKESVTTPIRIVYDCSCQGGGNSASLNDCLMVGLPFLNDYFMCHPTMFPYDAHAFMQFPVVLKRHSCMSNLTQITLDSYDHQSQMMSFSVRWYHWFKCVLIGDGYRLLGENVVVGSGLWIDTIECRCVQNCWNQRR